MATGETKETIIAPCETCEARVAGTVEGKFSEYIDEIDCSVRYVLLQCPSCRSAILVSQDDEAARYAHPDEDVDRWGRAERLYPAQAKRTLGAAVPESITKAFSEARSCFDARAHTACAIMCRKVLEGVCDASKTKKGSLAARLKELYERGELDKSLYEWITTLRLVGNEAAHDVEVTVSKEDASDLLDLTEAVTEYLFTFKEKYAAFQARRKTTSKKLTAKPSP